jgi:predicted Zn-dependent peptidase
MTLETQKFFEHTLANGLKLLVEPVTGVRSASFTLLVPAGVAHEPDDRAGLANLVAAMTTRGAGEYNSRELMRLQDGLGLQRTETAETSYAAFTVATTAEHLVRGLELTADVVRRPHLPEDQIEYCQSGILQEIQSLEDDPSQKLSQILRQNALPWPLGRLPMGTAESVEAMTIDDVASFHRQYYQPNGAVLGVAGAVDPADVHRVVERILGDWEPLGSAGTLAVRSSSAPYRDHVVSDKVQTHIGVAHESVPFADPDFFAAHGASSVLSGGMSARLWMEIREKRGLCYSVSASYLPFHEVGVLLTQAATTSADRAVETLDIIQQEIARLADGISAAEVDRVRAGLKASLVMQQESTAARASMLARHWHFLGRIRTVEEIARRVDELSPGTILDYLERRPLRELSIVTLGPQSVEVVA